MYITAQAPPPVSEMTYTVTSGTLNSTIPYHTVKTDYVHVGDQGEKYRAMYNYKAQNDDEVSIVKGDVVNAETLIDGWVFGVVQRTNQRGNIPANHMKLN